MLEDWAEPNNSNLFINLKYIITIFACTFLLFVITMIIKRIMFFNTYYLQVKEGLRRNIITYNVKILFIFKVVVCTFLSILYTYNFILILRNTNYLTEDFLCILFLALIFYLQFYYLTFNKENYDTYMDFKATITRRLFIILMISIVSYISLIMFINFELYKSIIIDKHINGGSGSAGLKGRELYMYGGNNNGSNNGEDQSSNNVIDNKNNNDNNINNKGKNDPTVDNKIINKNKNTNTITNEGKNTEEKNIEVKIKDSFQPQSRNGGGEVYLGINESLTILNTLAAAPELELSYSASPGGGQGTYYPTILRSDLRDITKSSYNILLIGITDNFKYNNIYFAFNNFFNHKEYKLPTDIKGGFINYNVLLHLSNINSGSKDLLITECNKLIKGLEKNKIYSLLVTAISISDGHSTMILPKAIFIHSRTSNIELVHLILNRLHIYEEKYESDKEYGLVLIGQIWYTKEELSKMDKEKRYKELCRKVDENLIVKNSEFLFK